MIFKNRRGSIFTAMMAAVVVIGLLGVTIFNRMIGPVSTMSRVNNRMMAEEHMVNSARALIRAATDCDSDTKKEAPVYVTGTGPTGGGIMPTNQGVHTTDPWGTKYGYCVWDVGATSDNAACGGPSAKRLDGTNDPSAGYESTTMSLALVSAGPDRTFQTTCAAYSNGTTAVLTPGGDDVVASYTNADVEGGGSGGGGSALWTLKGGDPTTGTISKNIEIQGSTAFNINYTTGDVTFDTLSVTPGKYIATGGLILPYPFCFSAPCQTATATGETYYTGADGDALRTWSGSAWKTWGNSVSAGTNPWTLSTHTISAVGNLVIKPPSSLHAAKTFSFTAPTSSSDNVMQFVPALGAFRAGAMGNADWYTSASSMGTYSFAYGTRLYARGYASVALGGAGSGQSIDNGAAGAWLSGDNSVITGPDTIGGFVHGTNHGIGNRAHNTVALGYNLDVTSSGTCTIDSNCAQNNILLGKNMALVWGASNSAKNNVYIGTGGSTSNSGSYNVVVNAGNTSATIPNTENNTMFMLGVSSTTVRFNQISASTGNAFIVGVGGSGANCADDNVASTAGGNWNQLASDMRLKKVIGPYERGLDDIIKLRPVVFQFKKDNALKYPSGTPHIGYLAQEVQKIFPEAVSDSDNDGYLEMFGDPIEHALVNATKDMNGLQEASAADMAALERRVDAIANKLGTRGSSWRNDIQLPGTALVVSLLLPLAFAVRDRKKR